MLIKNCAFVVTQNKKREVLENVDVRIKGDKIVEIAKNISPKEESIISGVKKILLPGLINAHTHLGMGSLRGLYDDQELGEWLEYIKAAENKFTAEDVCAAVKRGCQE